MFVSGDNTSSIDGFFLDAEPALEELKLRKQDNDLLRAVEEYLSHDVPACMSGSDLTLYFPRHLATPSHETLHVLDLARRLGAKLLIGEDTNGKFVTHNELKLPLGKLRFTSGKDRNGNEITVNKSVIDFSKSSGQPLRDIQTSYGVALPDFHHLLLEPWLAEDVVVFDEAPWIDRWARADVLSQYKRMFAFACCYSVMVEWFTPPEYEFAHKIMIPAFNSVRESLGVRPLMITPMKVDLDGVRDWNSYPQEVFETFSKLFRADSARQEG